MFNTLTQREREIAAMLAIGDSCREIANRLGVSHKTVDSHRHHVLKKIGARNTADLARMAIREGFVSMHDEVVSSDTTEGF